MSTKDKSTMRTIVCNFFVFISVFVSLLQIKTKNVTEIIYSPDRQRNLNKPNLDKKFKNHFNSN